MSSREEELKKYLAKREKKKNREAVAETKTSSAPEPGNETDPESFSTYFEIADAKSRLIVTGIIAVAISIGVAVLLTNAMVEQTLLNLLVFLTFGVIVFFPVKNLYSGYERYKQLASGTSVPVTGWNDFLRSRRESLWDGNYVYVCVRFDQDHQVSELERKALQAFMKTWINDWGYRYTNKGKWTYGQPKEFNRTGADRLEGHASISGVRFVMNQLMDKLPELLKLLTPGSLHITISASGPHLSTGIDDSEEREEERRSDQRHREMMQKDD